MWSEIFLKLRLLHTFQNLSMSLWRSSQAVYAFAYLAEGVGADLHVKTEG